MVRKKGYPSINELVVAKITETSQFAAWCDLLEYNLKGIIPISEAIGKWIFDIREVVKEGQVIVGKVLKVEEDKNLVHLSLKRVSEDEEKEKMNEFRKEERGEKLLELAAKQIGKTLDQAYEEVGFKLQEKFGSLYDAIVNIKRNVSKLEKMKISEEWINALINIAEKSLKEKEIEIKFELEIRSLEPNGIEIIKNLLKEIEEKSNAKIYYISAPIYRLELSSKDPKKDEKKILNILEKIKPDKFTFSFKRIE
ncbi:MAG: S1 RNA-binding domain-containing protein [Candidatus Aenigmatarchaeota archaeon]|jgi:translation initiation factor 2 subunit 1